MIYIMGRGHSGTTILDLLLGDCPNICGVGELIPGIERFDSETCSCSQKVTNCEFWQGVQKDFDASDFTWSDTTKLTQQAHLFKFPSTLISSTRRLKSLAQINWQLTQSIAVQSDCDFVVDSSKEATRGLLLARACDAKVIHLVRSPYEIVESNLNRFDAGKPFRLLRRNYHNPKLRYLFISISALGWTVGLLLSFIVGFFCKRNFLRIFYRELYSNPSSTMTTISKFLDTDMSSVIDKIESKQPLSVTHRIAGNRIRFDDCVVFRATRSKRRLNWLETVLVTLFTWPLFVPLRRHLVDPETG